MLSRGALPRGFHYKYVFKGKEMKKLTKLMAVVLCMGLLAGCTGNGAQTSQLPDQTETQSVADAGLESSEEAVGVEEPEQGPSDEATESAEPESTEPEITETEEPNEPKRLDETAVLMCYPEFDGESKSKE